MPTCKKSKRRVRPVRRGQVRSVEAEEFHPQARLLAEHLAQNARTAASACFWKRSEYLPSTSIVMTPTTYSRSSKSLL